MSEDLNAIIGDIRGRFEHVDHCPYQGRRVFFENAGGALTLKSVVQCSKTLAAVPDNQGRDNPASRELSKIIVQARSDTLTFLGASEGKVFVGESGTELIFRLISAAILGAPEGGNVVGSTLEHPASVSACVRWSKIAGRNYVQVPHNSKTGSVTADDYRPFLNADTRVATILHTSPVTGMSVDVEEIAKLIRDVSPDCFIIVDGIQHAAHGSVDIDACHIDGYAVSPYKVFSRHGYGIGWVSERMNVLPHDMLIGAAPDQWELGTRDAASYATFSKVVEYFDWLGAHFTGSADRRERIKAAGRAIHRHEKLLTDAMLYGTGNRRGLAEMDGIGIIGGVDNDLREGLVALTVDNKPSDDVVGVLRDHGVRTHARKADHFSRNILDPLGLKDCVRISACHYNTVDEVMQLLDAMETVCAR